METDTIKARIAALDADPGWYQNIDLKNGIQTKSRCVWGEKIDHPRERWEAVAPAFPKSFEGKSVLDIGCNAGFFSFVAAERGAAYVCGVDYNEKYIEQAKLANEIRGDAVDFRVGSTKTLRKLNRNFDITLCIGLLYHVGDIWGAICEISRITDEMAIVESAIHNDDDRLPLMRVAGQTTALPGTWHPNIAALRELFGMAGFKKTEVLFKNGARGGIVAYK
ncbi:MAG: class I SAM-dependent methyltransferase [Pseudomonadota bacterium]